MLKTLLAVLGLAVAVVDANAGTVRFRARLTGGGSPTQGRCIIRVRIDDRAEVHVNGANVAIRTLSGREGRDEGSECTSPLPNGNRIQDFQFRGIDGRGQVNLARDPRSNRGGDAVVYIADPDGGDEGYTFELAWGGGYGGGSGGGYPPPGVGPGYADRPGYDRPGYDNRPGFGNRPGNGPVDGRDIRETVRACEFAVRDEAYRRFNTNNVTFRDTTVDNNPGRNDWVMGNVLVKRGWRTHAHRFSCQVNFANGRVRTVNIDR